MRTAAALLVIESAPAQVAGLFALLTVSLGMFCTAARYLHWFKFVALGSIVVGIPPILRKAWAALRHRTLDINVLMTVAVAGACGCGWAWLVS
jgi:cation transport ATPase